MAERLEMTSEIGLAISDRGRLAVVKRSEGRVELFRGSDTSPANQIITEYLVSPYDVCFAPNNHLVITDKGDNTIKVYNLDKKPRVVRKFNCRVRNRDGKTSIEKCGSFNAHVLDSSDSLTLAPQNIIAGPSSSSQLFAVFANLIFVITMDWNTVEMVDFQRLSSPQEWASVQMKAHGECNKVSIVHDHGENHKVGGRNPLAVTKAQFCAMFYHVTERKRDNITYKCLQRPRCRVGKMARQVNPRADYAPSVVVYVRLTDQTGRMIFHARYGNCFEGKRRNTTHAEYYMLMDEEFREAVRLLRADQRGGSINMFMNKQPCYRSTKHHDRMSDLKRKECAQDLVDFYNLHCSSYGISFTINLCQLYKVDRVPTPQFEEDILNGQEGMRRMISAGIELKAMTETSWQQLAGYANIELPEYQGGDRQKLDQHIHKFLIACARHNFSPLQDINPRKTRRKVRSRRRRRR